MIAAPQQMKQSMSTYRKTQATFSHGLAGGKLYLQCASGRQTPHQKQKSNHLHLAFSSISNNESPTIKILGFTKTAWLQAKFIETNHSSLTLESIFTKLCWMAMLWLSEFVLNCSQEAQHYPGQSSLLVTPSLRLFGLISYLSNNLQIITQKFEICDKINSDDKALQYGTQQYCLSWFSLSLMMQHGN